LLLQSLVEVVGWEKPLLKNYWNLNSTLSFYHALYVYAGTLLSSEYLCVSQARQENSSQKVQNLQINYDDIPSMAHEFERHKIHTIISAIGLVSDETSQSQLNLIEAGEKSVSTKRFIPSEYSFIQTPK
jgi:hypothetical protein